MAKFEDKLTELLERIREEYNLPGYDCSVWQNGQEIYRRMTGFADLETETPVTENTLYNMYSNTKVVTCVAAMQLWEKGLFLLEDPFSMYFPEFAEMKVKTEDGNIVPANNPITIRDLFRMTAGIGDGGDYTDMGMQFYMETGGECPILRLPEFLARVPLMFEPGTKFRYGICHEMLAALIEKLSGEPFADYLENHIFRPLGMNNTAFTLEKTESKALANQYRFEGKDKPLVSLGAPNCLIPPILKASASGGLISSVDDYMKFQVALAEGEKLLSRHTIDLMRLNQLTGTQWENYGYTHLGMGYGLGVRTVVDQAACGAPIGFGPFGWGGATGSYGSIDPENNLCIFYMQHIFDSNDVRIHNRLRNVIYSGI